MGKRTRPLWAVLLIVYALGMVWLMFLNRPRMAVPGLNLIPFRTVTEFAALLRDTSRAYLRRIAAVNLLGNVAMFLPLGFLPAMVFPRLRRWGRILIAAAAVIVLAEAVQYLTLRGSADIDDLILNLIGTALGFGIFRVFERIYNKRHPA